MPLASCRLDHETIRRVYMSSGTDAEIARREHMGRQTVARIREGIDHSAETMWLPAGERITKAYEEARFPMSDEEMQQRLAIASCLKVKHRGGCILEDPKIDELLPV